MTCIRMETLPLWKRIAVKFTCYVFGYRIGYNEGEDVDMGGWGYYSFWGPWKDVVVLERTWMAGPKGEVIRLKRGAG